jgi:hypothetical protein
VNAEINVGENSFLESESDFTQGGNIVVIFNMFCSFIQRNTACKRGGGSISLFEKKSRRRGIVSSFVTKCCKCDHTADTMTSNITRSRLYDNIIRLVYGLLSIGKSRDAGKMLRAMRNIPQPPTSFSIYSKTIGSAVADVSVSVMMQGAGEAVAENEENDPSHVTVWFGGTCQKRGYTSLNGIILANSFDTGKF